MGLRVDGSPEGDESGWLSRERVTVVVFIVFTAVAFYLCFRLLYPFVPALSWALALVIIADPIHRWIGSRVPFPGVAAAISVAIVFLLFVTPALFVAHQFVQQVAVSAEQIQEAMKSGRFRTQIEQNERLAPAVRWIDENVNVSDEVRHIVENVSSGLEFVVTGSFWLATQLLITMLVLFYFFRDRKLAISTLRSLMPLTNAETDELFRMVSNTIHASIFGTILVALVQGFLGGLMFHFLGLSAPVLWGAVMAFLAIIPVLGAFVVWVPAAIGLAVAGDWASAIVLTVWGTIVVALVDNFLYPIFVGDRMRLHTLPVFFAIGGGLIVFGGSGIVLGPLVLAVTDALLNFWRIRTSMGRSAEQTTG